MITKHMFQTGLSYLINKKKHNAKNICSIMSCMLGVFCTEYEEIRIVECLGPYFNKLHVIAMI